MNNLFKYYPNLKVCEEDINIAIQMIVDTYEDGGKILTCGNGGSAAHAEHITTELMKNFLINRGEVEINDMTLQYGIPSICINSNSSLITAINNDMDNDLIFAQQILCYGNDDDMLICLSTSGTSQNIINALEVSHNMGIKSLLITGDHDIEDITTTVISIPETKTYKIQNLIQPIYHHIIENVEAELF